MRTAIERMQKIGFTKVLDMPAGKTTRLSFSAVMMKNNIDYLEDLKKYADSIDAQFICKVPTLTGRALNNIDNMFEVSEYDNIRKKLFQYTAKRETLMVDTPKCMAWHYGPTISSTGEVRECYTSPCNGDKRIGNVREKPLIELLKRRNEVYDITTVDFCPVKTRINKSFEEQGLHKIWTITNDDKKKMEVIKGY